MNVGMRHAVAGCASLASEPVSKGYRKYTSCLLKNYHRRPDHSPGEAWLWAGLYRMLSIFADFRRAFLTHRSEDLRPINRGVAFCW